MSDLSVFNPWQHEAVALRYGTRSGAFIAVAIHSTVQGPATGGTRIWSYASWTDALADALALSRAMTWKATGAGIAAGGGKAVIAIPSGGWRGDEHRDDALRDLADIVNEFGGQFRTGEDVGVGTDELLTLARHTTHVLGLPDRDGTTGEPSTPTAEGVLASIDATLREAFGSSEASGRHFAVIGLGQIGSRVARELALRGASLTVTDLNEDRRLFADEIGARWVQSTEILSVDADVLVPAGLGGVLNASVIDHLRVRAVVGPANNPLSAPGDAQRLHDRGILYAPDFIVNAGGVAYTVLRSEGLTDGEALDRVKEIGGRLTAVFSRANAEGVTPLAAAERTVADLLARTAA